jgi:ketosteroid isomerase-like protein
MRTYLVVPIIAALALQAACTSLPRQPDVDAAKAQVIATERAFAKTMADRSLEAFATFIAEEAVFFSDATPLRGKRNVVADWAPLFASAAAPFSWEPDSVEVLDSGALAISSGPVRNAQGKVVARFNSIWRLEAPNTWRIIFDKGSPVCKDGKP